MDASLSYISHRLLTSQGGIGVSTQSWQMQMGEAVEHRTVNRGDDGSIPPTDVLKLTQFHSPHIACVFWKRH